MSKTRVTEIEIDFNTDDPITIRVDRDAEPGVRMYLVRQSGAGGEGLLYITLAGLRALLAAAEQLESQ